MSPASQAVPDRTTNRRVALRRPSPSALTKACDDYMDARLCKLQTTEAFHDHCQSAMPTKRSLRGTAWLKENERLSELQSEADERDNDARRKLCVVAFRAAGLQVGQDWAPFALELPAYHLQLRPYAEGDSFSLHPLDACIDIVPRTGAILCVS